MLFSKKLNHRHALEVIYLRLNQSSGARGSVFFPLQLTKETTVVAVNPGEKLGARRGTYPNPLIPGSTKASSISQVTSFIPNSDWLFRVTFYLDFSLITSPESLCSELE